MWAVRSNQLSYSPECDLHFTRPTEPAPVASLNRAGVSDGCETDSTPLHGERVLPHGEGRRSGGRHTQIRPGRQWPLIPAAVFPSAESLTFAAMSSTPIAIQHL